MRLGAQFKIPNSKFLIRTPSAVRHANIVQRVKSCYKIEINSRESKSCFYGVMRKRIRDASIYMSKKYRSSFYS